MALFMKSALGLFTALFFTLVAQERKFLVQVPGHVFESRVAFDGISKAEAKPKSQQKCLCTKMWKCSVYLRMEI